MLMSGQTIHSCDLSIVTTVYNSSSYIDEFCTRMIAAASQISDNFEIIIVNDGSPDDSLEKALLHLNKRYIHVVDLSRNFGHHQALMAGLSVSRGSYVFMIDSDLEEQPEWIVDFYRDLHTSNADVVYGVRDAEKGGLTIFLSNLIFYNIINSVLSLKIPRYACTVRIMRREYVDALLSTHERNLFLGGTFAWVGFRQTERRVIVVKKTTSAYTLAKRLSLAMLAVTSFTSAPLFGLFVLGLGITIISMCIAIYVIVRWLVSYEYIVTGWTSLVTAVLFSTGILTLSIGIIGIYIGRIFDEVKHRPPFVVRRIYSHDNTYSGNKHH